MNTTWANKITLKKVQGFGLGPLLDYPHGEECEQESKHFSVLHDAINDVPQIYPKSACQVERQRLGFGNWGGKVCV